MHLVKPFPVVAAFLVKGNNTYVSRRTNTTYSGRLQNVGGKVNAGETNIAALAREILEETGLVIDPVRFHVLGIVDAINERGIPYRVFAFLVLLKDNEQPLLLEPDKQGPWELRPIDDLCQHQESLVPALVQTLALVREAVQSDFTG